MQKWCPEPFSADAGGATATLLEPAPEDFQQEAIPSEAAPGERSRLFMSEKGFKGPEAIMAHLTPEERAQVFELVEQDITREYEEKEAALKKGMDQELLETRRIFDEAFAAWTENYTAAQAEYLRETSAVAARLALQLAEKIVRQRVAEDPEVLVRGLETALFKVENSRETTISVHPREAQWLQEQPELLEKLGVKQIIADRRVEAGGCLVRTEKREWDATIAGQLTHLTELVEEMLATQDPPEIQGKDGTDVDPVLD